MAKRDLYEVVEAYLSNKRRAVEKILENWKKEKEIISGWKEVFCDRCDEDRRRKSLRVFSSFNSL